MNIQHTLLMYTLHDGDTPITSIGIVMFLKNNEEYVKRYLHSGVFDRLFKLYPECEFVLYFGENDSTDATVEQVQQILVGKKGYLFSEHLDLPFKKTPEDHSFDRIARIAHIRNHFMDKVKGTPTFHEHQWVLFIDTDIYFDEIVLHDMMKHAPRANNIAMMTCKTINMMRDKDDQLWTDNHYYDTFAFVDSNNTMFYPNCVFPNCGRCKLREGASYIENTTLLDVRSAWGGFVLIHRSVFDHPTVKWLPMQFQHGDSLCEHVYFCDTLRATTNNRIVVCVDVECYRPLPAIA